MIVSVDLIRIPLEYVLYILNFLIFLGGNGQDLTLEVQDPVMSRRSFFPVFFLLSLFMFFACSVERSNFMSTFESRQCRTWFLELYKLCLHVVTVCTSDMKAEGLLSKLNLQCSIIFMDF